MRLITAVPKAPQTSVTPPHHAAPPPVAADHFLPFSSLSAVGSNPALIALLYSTLLS